MADICGRCAVSRKLDTPYHITLKCNQTFIQKTDTPLRNLECAVSVLIIKNRYLFKIKRVVLTKVNAPYFRYVLKYKIFDSEDRPYRLRSMRRISFNNSKTVFN